MKKTMIICSNCGAINSDETSRFCRKCGALLPVSSTSQRTRISKVKSKKKEDEIKISSIGKSNNLDSKSEEKLSNNNQVKVQLGFFAAKEKKNDNPNQLKLQEIPKPKKLQASNGNSSSPPKIIQTEDLKNQLETIPNENIIEVGDNQKPFLKEIKPKPFDGAIISSRKPYSPPKQEPFQKNEAQSKDQSKISENSILKQKQLEQDMSEVLAVLSKKLKIPKKYSQKQIILKIEETEQTIVPESMNEILIQILKLDQFIEASALIKLDGTILASALSNRISDTLFLTIGQNLSMIGNDVIEGLSAGKLSSISIRGTEGILDLAPIDKKIPELNDIMLMIFSHSRVKPGIIAFAVGIVKKQIKKYLGIK